MINNHENIKNNSNKSAVYNTVISKHCCGVNDEKEGEGGDAAKREKVIWTFTSMWVVPRKSATGQYLQKVTPVQISHTIGRNAIQSYYIIYSAYVYIVNVPEKCV